MINAIIKGLFSLITKFFDLLLAPIVLVITSLFPNMADLYNHIITFLNYAFTYIRSILRLLLINDSMITTLFNYFFTLYAIYVAVISIRFAIKIYNKFKL